MKYDVQKWQAVAAGAASMAETGKLHLRVADPTAKLFIVNDDGETIFYGLGHEFKIECRQAFAYVLETKEKLAYVYQPKAQAAEPQGEVYTNADRQPHESGTLLEVRKAARKVQLEMLLERRRLEAEQRKQREAERERVERQEAEQAEREETNRAIAEAEAAEKQAKTDA